MPWLVPWIESCLLSQHVFTDPLFTTGVINGEFEATAGPCLMLTVPSIKLNISSLITSNWDLRQDDALLNSLEGL